jgi:hypothetical protein
MYGVTMKIEVYILHCGSKISLLTNVFTIQYFFNTFTLHSKIR